MRRKAGRLLMVAGLLMVLAAALLLLRNRREAEAAAVFSSEAVERIRARIGDGKETEAPKKREKLSRIGALSPARGEEPELPAEKPLPVAEIDGYGYIGYLTVPAVGLELPVMDVWDYPRLRISPCREEGETAAHLVIMAHNYRRHFGFLNSATAESVPYVLFTDMDGETSVYRVGTIETISPTDHEKIDDPRWNLVLYTCTYGGRTRIMLGAERLTEAEKAEALKEG